MMNSKYRGLPDIDTAADVFETPDEPEQALRPPEDEDFEEAPIKKAAIEGVDSSGLPGRRKAEKVFSRKQSSYVFRPQLPSLHPSSSDSETEISVPKESAASRLRRIKAELAEVEKEMAESPVAESSSSGSTLAALPSAKEKVKRKSVIPPREPLDIVSELSFLRERIGAVDLSANGLLMSSGDGNHGDDNWKQRLDKLGVQEEAHPNGDNSGGKEGDEGSDAHGSSEGSGLKLSELDKRLAYLENLVGPSGEGLDQNTSSPIIPTVNKLDHLLALLTQPRHLDVISRRVKLLLVDLDRAASASRRPPNTPNPNLPQPASSSVTLTSTEYTTFQTLFSLLPRLDPLLPILDPLLTRLRSLSSLHSEAGDIADGLKRLREGDKRSEGEFKDLEEVVRGVQKGMDGAVEGIGRNWEGLEQRMKSLEKRLEEVSKG